ncbi:deoxyribodipyrimidine photo-lyase [Acinetobacter rathckeae]|uniref:deoxyribodipyrimidine photo-lyase n=1 Tax=Acinetobacter rathckeae TaxID=2605272 RepID=UPI0018A32D5D|nr:deoxyribodipyrimidine photo-lyase [Acinetobacter rathckeae]MBF7686904.1 deoxyribodipyrimidine photo-lyase [Acinetobacter rathckeae]MBF7694692.1 deoxyribodipyrimidine photo-lyase [Acinetobacter rathckeae]
MPTHLIWFRQDLRIQDNSALWHATQQGNPCIAVVILSPEQWKLHHDATCKINFYLRQLKTLQQQLLEKNIPLIVAQIEQWKDIANYMLTLTEQLSITDVYANAEYAVYEKKRDDATLKILSQHAKTLHLFQDHTLFPKGTIRTQNNQPYKVFTPFKKACFERLQHSMPQCYPDIEQQENITLPKDIQQVCLDDMLTHYPVSEQILQLWPVGEPVAHEKLNDFLQHNVKQYQDTRDFPAIQGTSRISAYLNIGMISARQCLQALFQPYHGEFVLSHKGDETWLTEILWREFYQHIMVDFPKVSKAKPFKDETNRLVWRDAPSDFEKWTQGQTGIPIVDAGMRELKQTGWMHNRVRMICAMFLTKNLLIDWREGERWFMQHLIDGELAANNGGWQWSASTGTDAAPYFRIFNPVTQSERFDPEGKYIKQWVPELASLQAKQIHAPFAHKIGYLDYPKPIVDLKSSRVRAIEAFKNL